MLRLTLIISGFRNLSELPISSQTFKKKILSYVNKAKLVGIKRSNLVYI